MTIGNQLFARAKERILNGEIDFDTNVINARLVDDTYVYSAAQDVMTGVTKVNGTTDFTLTSPTIINGVFDCPSDALWTAVEGGHTAEAVVLYKFVTDDAGSHAIAWIDVITGFPLATNGGNITVQWDNGAYKIFSL